MTNELLVVGTAVLDLAVVLVAFRLGKSYLLGTIVVNLIMVSLAAPKVGTFFGVVGSPQSIFYASIFLATDLLAEFHGKKASYEAVRTGLLVLLMLAGLGQVVVHFTPIPDAADYGASFDTIFGATWRVALGSYVAYLVAQNFDIWFFHRLRLQTKGGKLWLRNLLSTSTSQLIDTLIFFPIAFAGVIPQLAQVMVVAYVVKVIVAILDTPFIYAARLISPTPPVPVEVVQ